MPQKTRSSNDQRSDVHNPTSREHKSAQDNRSRQLNPEDVRYHQSRNQPAPEPEKKP